MTQSEMVRKVAERDYVGPAMLRREDVRIRVGDLERTLIGEGFPPRHINQICSALESKKFWQAGLAPLGPRVKPRRVDTVYEFSLNTVAYQKRDTPIEFADPLLELRGFLRGAIIEGADAFVRDLRRDKEVSR